LQLIDNGDILSPQQKQQFTVPFKTMSLVDGCDFKCGQPGIMMKDKIGIVFLRYGRLRTLLLHSKDI
jgi:hypothetical protein